MAKMTDPVQSCPPPPKNKCDEIRAKIDELINRERTQKGCGTKGLKFRLEEQINGRNGPGTKEWIGHETAIKNQQRAIEKLLEQYKREGCGPPPSEALEWATKPVPKPAEWKGAGQNTAKAVGVLAVLSAIAAWLGTAATEAGPVLAPLLLVP
jgi:hypothetical protein